MRIHADPDPAVFLNAVLDPDPGPGPGPAQPNLKKKKHQEFVYVVKNIKDCSKVRNNGACANLHLNNFINLHLLAIDLHFFSFS